MVENIERRRRVLPHWTADNVIYFVTFRLHDSLPASLAESARLERMNIVRTAQQMNRDLSDGERERLRQLRRKLELALDKGHGHCWMRNPAIARIVADALRHFEGERYELLAWCVMPNHVHVVARTAPEWQLSRILHSWKSFTAHQITRLHGCPRPFWQREYYDRIMRNDHELRRAIRYVENNPTAAGLSNWPWVSSTTPSFS
jgi:REP element-mobilizing transposase RayT